MHCGCELTRRINNEITRVRGCFLFFWVGGGGPSIDQFSADCERMLSLFLLSDNLWISTLVMKLNNYITCSPNTIQVKRF